jgi:PPE-repeat protein
MTAALDFAVLPPEINSARMYSGVGTGPMLAAASAWNGLAAEMRATAMSYGSVLTALTGEEWYGPASASMAAAAAPYVSWMSVTAAQAEETAAKAEAAAAAYEMAFAATVPPAVIAENRVRLTALIATNIVGQNTPAIAAAEAAYAEMWAQDAGAMYGYAASSAAATQLSIFTQPQQITSPGALTAQSGAAQATQAGTQQSTLAQLISAVPNALQGLAGWNPLAAGSAADTAGLDGLLNMVSGQNTALGQFLNANILNTIFSSGFYMPSNTLAPFLGLASSGAADTLGAPADSAAGTAIEAPVSGLGSLGSSVAAGLGNSPVIGALSVPPTWTAPAPGISPLASALGGTPMVAPPPAAASSMPPVPMNGMAGQGYGRAVPQYGFRPSFVARPPAAG